MAKKLVAHIVEGERLCGIALVSGSSPRDEGRS